MAFSIEEVERVFISGEGTYFYKAGEFEKSNNYKVVADYLTGNITTLQGLQTDESIFCY